MNALVIFFSALVEGLSLAVDESYAVDAGVNPDAAPCRPQVGFGRGFRSSWGHCSTPKKYLKKASHKASRRRFKGCRADNPANSFAW